MNKLNSIIDKLVYSGDKQDPDTFRKGRFFVISIFIFGLITFFYFPFYYNDSSNSIPLIKPLYYLSMVVLLATFFLYPRFGYRNLLFILFGLPSGISSFVSVYYTTGGIYSSDIGMSVVMILFIFLLTNKLIGFISVILHIIIYLFFYYAAIKGYRNFKMDVMALDADYYITITIVSFAFTAVMVYLHEKGKDKYLAELKKAKSEIEDQKAEIISSITYAKRIQQSKLPKIHDFHTLLPQSFILFKPKDIVSGDFYHFHHKNDLVFVAAADCTGHGVPGAIMSMICSEKLEEAISSSNDLAHIMTLVNRRVKLSLKQTDDTNSTKDGMDIALCMLHRPTQMLSYTGANRPLWIIRHQSNLIEEIKATKKAIGGFTGDDQQFDAHNLQLQKGDTIYIFSDGYADTFGGPENKKLTTKKFKEILLSIQHLSLNEQEHYLNNFINDWKGQTEQIDDILVIGLRV